MPLPFAACANNTAISRLEDVSFNVPGGSIVGLIGENGAGKSTTLKCILNLVRRDRGEIRLLGRDAIADEQQVKQEIGVVLDETSFHDSLRPMDVERILRRIYRCWDPARFAACLQKFHLPRDRYIRDFSRGMKMKLAIAAALAHHPAC